MLNDFLTLFGVAGFLAGATFMVWLEYRKSE